MAFNSIQTGFSAGEISPRLFGRTDLAKYAIGCGTLRNFYSDYRGGASSRAGLGYVGMCKQGAPNTGGTSTNNPPRDIPFQFSISQGYALEFGDLYMRIKSDGAYVVETGTNITGITSADPVVITDIAHGYNDGDWVFISGVVGTTELNGLTWIVVNKTTDTYELTDLFGNAVDSTGFGGYVSGGTAARIYTVVSPYSAVDLPFLKYTQSADTMTLTCVNQQTNTEYPSYELVRNGATSWVFSADTFGSSITAPNKPNVSGYNSTALSTWYSYVVTAVDAVTGDESVASPVGTVQNNDISINAGSNVIGWNTIAGAGSYNIYAATPSYSVQVPIGASFGYIGSAFGNEFTDTNIVADFTTVPPVHNDPFARGQIARVTPVSVGISYSQSSVGYTINTSTGTGAVIAPVVVSRTVIAYIVQNAGKNYAASDTITITGAGTSNIATATLSIGSLSGTYPGVCAYFQQRRAYGFTLDNPDTYFMSRPGQFNNMDSSIPITDDDAIIGSPWAQQINGIQALVPMPGGLVILTGKGAWQLNGGGATAAITPADQIATPQAYNGCHFHVPPLVVNYDILYVQAKGSIIRDLSYNFFVNIYTGTDMTVLSEHLFNFHQVREWAYAEEPFKLVWCVRDDGIMLCLTYLKEQDVYAWSRHDTNGLFIGVCSITEPPTDAVYVITKRYIQGEWVYYSERMNSRNWQTVEDCFCVDAGLSLTLTYPDAVLTPHAAAGTDNISLLNVISTGRDYTAPVISAVDPTGQGSGFSAIVYVAGGVITGYAISDRGTNYQPGTQIHISDSTGSGGKIAPIITNNVTFVASAGVFTTDNIGDVIRIGNGSASPSSTDIVPIGGGKAVIVEYISDTEVIANITQEITNIVPNDPDDTPIPVSSGYWSLGTPVEAVSGLNHLEGMEVAILADGSVVANQTVVNGTVNLPAPYSAVTVGLPYTCQLQTLPLEVQSRDGGTVQGKRKNIVAVTARVQDTRGISIGTNQPDASTQPNGIAPEWTNMAPMKQRNSTIRPGAPIPLVTGDLRELVQGKWDKPGQIAIQVTDCVPANILALMPEFVVGDNNG